MQYNMKKNYLFKGTLTSIHIYTNNGKIDSTQISLRVLEKYYIYYS